MRILICIFLSVMLFGCGDDNNEIEQPPIVSLIQIPTPRGLAGLHCNQPEARINCDQIVSILHDSLISKPAINYLVDGSFSFSASQMISDIDKLTQDGRELYVTFFMLNGATQRRCPTSRGWRNDLCPDQFMNEIKYNLAFRESFKSEVVARLVPVVQFAQSRNAIVTIIPALEDNIDITSINILNQLILQLLPNVRLGRNPCSGDHVIPDGSIIEIHPGTENEVWCSNCQVINDGDTYDLPGDAALNYYDSYPDKTTWEELKRMRDKSVAFNNVFQLWKADVQGLGSYNAPDAAGRWYRPFSPQDIADITGFLRGK